MGALYTFRPCLCPRVLLLPVSFLLFALCFFILLSIAVCAYRQQCRSRISVDQGACVFILLHCRRTGGGSARARQSLFVSARPPQQLLHPLGQVPSRRAHMHLGHMHTRVHQMRAPANSARLSAHVHRTPVCMHQTVHDPSQLQMRSTVFDADDCRFLIESTASRHLVNRVPNPGCPVLVPCLPASQKTWRRSRSPGAQWRCPSHEDDWGLFDWRAAGSQEQDPTMGGCGASGHGCVC